MPDNEPIHQSPYERSEPRHNPRFGRDAALLGGGALLLGLGIAAGVMFTRDNAEPAMDFPPTSAGVIATDPDGGHATQLSSQRSDDTPVRAATRSAERSTSTSGGARSYESRTIAKAVCDHCGVIESVTPVAVQGQSTGVGAVAGGVLGGVVGNQVGKGSGNTAATVLGAIGGGIAGNEIEKSRRTNTVYRVKVRMDDGSTKTFTRNTELSPGTKVEVNDGAMRVVGGEG
jgi:outer membrane lipoprotein SlyB